MRASLLLKRLQFLIKRDGDLPVRIYDPITTRFDAVHEAEPRRVLPIAEVEERFIGLDAYPVPDEHAQLRYDNTPFGSKTQ